MRFWPSPEWDVFKERALALLPDIGQLLEEDPLGAGEAMRAAAEQAEHKCRLDLPQKLRNLYGDWGKFFDQAHL